MEKTLYDFWFLQFEFPNEEGKPYKSSGGKMVWNEELKREIPEGWEVDTVKKCICHINTGLNPRDNFKLGNGHIKYITVKNLTINGTIDFSGCDQIDEDARKIVHKRSDVSKGDILFVFGSWPPTGCFPFFPAAVWAGGLPGGGKSRRDNFLPPPPHGSAQKERI